MIKYLIRNGFWVTIKQGINMSLGLLVAVALARMTSLEIYGKFQLILSILGIVSIISMSGFNTSIISSIAKGFDGSYRHIIKIKFLWSLLGIPILLFIGLYFYITKEYIISYSFFIYSIIFPFIYGLNIWPSLLIGKEKFKTLAKFNSIQSIVNSLFIILSLFLIKNNLVILISFYAISLGITNYIITKKTFKYITNQYKDINAISYGYFITKISIINIILEHFDKILIGYFIGIPELAIYSIGINIAKSLKIGIKNFLCIISPKIAKYNTFKLKYYIPTFIISCIGTGVIYGFLPILITILFGEKYIDSIFLSQIAIIFIPFYIITILVKNHFIFNLRDKKILTKNTIIFPMIKLLLMIPLLYYFNISGLAFLVGFQYVIELGIIYILFYYKNIIRIFNYCMPISRL